ncbi:MAG: M20 family peptidase, partial [Edwardsiella sp. (in: enterobacteria)]
MDLEKYIDELQTLVNVDCGTQTVAGVAQVAAVMRELWLQEGWNTEQIDLGSAVGPALLATN